MRKPSQRCDFAAFFNVVGISRTMARPARTLSQQTLVCAGRTQNSTKSSLTRFRSEEARFTLPRLTLKHSTIWIRLSLLFKWVIVVVKIAKLSSTQSIRLAITGGKKANRTSVPAIDLESFHLRLDPRLWRSGLKYPVPVVHTNSPNPSNLKKSTLGSGLENMRFLCADSLGSNGDGNENVKKQ